jgi:hypothetical protein
MAQASGGKAAVRLARLHGGFNVISGAWPLLHRRSFEAVLGPKRDYWLVSTVALLLLGNGTVQLTAPDTVDGLAMARRLGMVTAASLGLIDMVNVPRERVSRMYLVDAAVEAAWLLVWTRVNEQKRCDSSAPMAWRRAAHPARCRTFDRDGWGRYRH